MTIHNIHCFSAASSRTWFQPGRDANEVVTLVTIAGAPRWLKATIRNGRVIFSEMSGDLHRNKWKPAKPAVVSVVESKVPSFARGQPLPTA